MSQDDSNTHVPDEGTPTTEADAHEDVTPVFDDDGSDETERGGFAALTGNVPLLVGLGLVLLVGVIGFVVLGGGGEEEAASNCIKDEVRITVAPAMADVVGEAVDAVGEEEKCIEFTVSEGTVKDVVGMLNDPDAAMPELWIPDGPTWTAKLAAAGWSGSPITEVVAQSPVGLVSGPAAESPASWAAAVESGALAMQDPESDGASALALLAPYAEAKATGRTPEQLKAAAVSVAQNFGERAVGGEDTATDMSAISATSTQLVPLTEQGYLAARRSNDSLTLVTPRTGAPMLEYPIIALNKGSIDVFSGARDDRSARAGRALSHWFASEEGRAALSEAEFRLPGQNQLEGGIGIGQVKNLPKVKDGVASAALRDWNVLSVPSSILSVTDLSGSMKEALGAESRIQVVAGAATLGLEALPDHARIGSWGFSKNRGGEGVNYEEYFPMTPLGGESEGQEYRDVLRDDIAKMPSRVKGATGLFDTTLAAYETALEEWDPAYFNSVVIWTDGASDDSSSISLERLLSDLKAKRDPSRPVRVVIIGISPDAQSPAMTQIANATGGQFFLVSKADEMVGVLAQALLSR